MLVTPEIINSGYRSKEQFNSIDLCILFSTEKENGIWGRGENVNIDIISHSTLI